MELLAGKIKLQRMLLLAFPYAAHNWKLHYFFISTNHSSNWYLQPSLRWNHNSDEMAYISLITNEKKKDDRWKYRIVRLCFQWLQILTDLAVATLVCLRINNSHSLIPISSVLSMRRCAREGNKTML